MNIVSTLFFALAVSVDAFIVGAGYGLRGISLPLVSRLLIAATSGSMIAMASFLGLAIAPLAGSVAGFLGALVLVVMGIWIIINTSSHSLFAVETGGPAEQNKTQVGQEGARRHLITSICLKPLGIVVQILKEPSRADLDRSGSIAPGEAILLGLALALDAFGGGLGVALTGSGNTTLPLAVIAMNFAFLHAGTWSASRRGNFRLSPQIAALPGYIFILLGLLKSLLVIL